MHLKEEGHSFEDENVYVLERKARWFERRVEDVKLEQPSLNKRGSFSYQPSAVLKYILMKPQFTPWLI